MDIGEPRPKVGVTMEYRSRSDSDTDTRTNLKHSTRTSYHGQSTKSMGERGPNGISKRAVGLPQCVD